MQVQTQNAERRRSAPEFALRGELALRSPGKNPDQALLSRIRSFDDKLVLAWVDDCKRWAIYRLCSNFKSAHGAVCQLQGVLESEDGTYREPGEFIIDELRKRDLRVITGEQDEAKAQRKYMDHLDALDEKREEDIAKKRREMGEQMAKDVGWLARGRLTISKERSKQVQKARPGTKVIVGPTEQEIRHYG